MPLTDTAIRRAKAKKKPYKMFDSGGLFLIVNPAGGKWWRFKYRFEGKEKLLSLGTYPEVSLKEAREKREHACKQVAAGIDPSEHRKAHKASRLSETTNSFEAVAREWLAKFSPNWVSSHSDKIKRRLERDIFPWIGAKPISDVTAPELLSNAAMTMPLA